MTTKGLTVTVYRGAGFPDCTNDGLSSRVDQAILVGLGVDGPIETTIDDVILVLVRHTLRDGSVYLHVEPEIGHGRARYMFGGNFIYISDSRFREVCPYPIPIHDRREGAYCVTSWDGSRKEAPDLNAAKGWACEHLAQWMEPGDSIGHWDHADGGIVYGVFTEGEHTDAYVWIRMVTP